MTLSVIEGGLTGRPTTPRTIVRAAMRAILSFVDAKGEGLKAGASGFDIYTALAPILEGYAIADAVPLAGLLRDAVNGSNAARESEALSQALWAVEGFVAHARACGLDCVKSRAAMLASSVDDDGVLDDNTQRVAALMLQRDIEELAVGKFEGDRFDDFVKGKGSWLYDFLYERDGISAVDVDESLGRPHPVA